MSKKSRIKELHVPVSGWTKDLKGQTLKTDGRDMCACSCASERAVGFLDPESQEPRLEGVMHESI